MVMYTYGKTSSIRFYKKGKVAIGSLIMSLENDGKKWTWEETLLAFDLYSRIEYSKISVSHREIIHLAELLKRKPGAVTKKLYNIASHDPKQIDRGRKALPHSSKFDKRVWEEFEVNPESTVYEATKELAARENKNVDYIVDTETSHLIVEAFPYGEDREAATKIRVGQAYFRKAILSAYNNQCCITGINEKRLLVASHIKPWSISDKETERVNPRNGLCLNALHDKAFDRGLLTVTPNYEVLISSKLRETQMDDNTKTWFYSYEHTKICLPDKFKPDKEYLEYHNEVVFLH